MRFTEVWVVPLCQEEGGKHFKLSTGRASFWLQRSSECAAPAGGLSVLDNPSLPSPSFLLHLVSLLPRVRWDVTVHACGAHLSLRARAHACDWLWMCWDLICVIFLERHFKDGSFHVQEYLACLGYQNQLMLLSYLLRFEVVLYAVLESFSLGF